MVIERFKSGFEPPTDFPFDDLSRPDSIHYTPPIRMESAPTVKNTISVRVKKRVGLFGIFSTQKNNISGNGEKQDDFSDLPPNQKKNKLQSKIEEIQRKIHQATAARDGLMKMKGVYEQNSNLGDPMTVEDQLAENGQMLDKLRQELHVYQSRLEDVNTNQNNSHNHTPLHNNVNGLRRQHRNSGGSGGDEDSLSRSASDSSVSANHNHKQSAPGTPVPSHGPESGIAGSHTSLSDDAPPPYYDTELLPPLGTCRALYPFEATSEGSMAMSDGEELLVIEVDQVFPKQLLALVYLPKATASIAHLLDSSLK
ncbi:hypothetical protein GE061_019358 [Apolygus lucorum]|uniref:REM-1 domain-containing protein n=1 Tax=Apolygus lucorum TaxID=248454 RepID=A0A8S9XA59_APOLU|nr:hypothetical protein GE061_019358 [Apolygus lucorum]